MDIKQKDQDRFFSKVDSTAKDDCHPWQACTTQDGYGLFYLNGKLECAHRVAYTIGKGPIKEDMVIRHGKDCPTNCVNPNHLKEGTHADNMRDRDEAGTTPKGESSGRSKLKNYEVKQIRRRAKHGDTQASIAKYFNVSPPTVGNIVNRKTWKHLK